MLDGLRTARGVIRSLRIYYGDRPRRDAMDRLYASFVAAGDLVFDIGAHVGDRVGAFRRLGCKVVAVEPQPALARTLRLIYGRDADVRIEAALVGRTTGETDLRLNIDNPTISTASPALIAAAAQSPAWRDEAWPRVLRLPMTTLDALIGRHGPPAFVKIDVEGFEAEVLHGLTRRVPALSFEFTTIQRDVALAALERCAGLGFMRFNSALGESQRFVHSDWTDAAEMRAWLLSLPEAANSGDIYAVLG